MAARLQSLLRMKLQLLFTAAVTLAVPATAAAQSAIIYGALSNFDISNDTGRDCHGFEIELEGITPGQVPYSFTAQRYGAPTILSYAAGTRVRWESPYDAASGRFVQRTLPHTVAWFPGQCYQWNPATYEDSGCEHFGTGLTANPVRVTARWLCGDPSNPGVLVPMDPPTAVPSPTYYVQPPVRADNPPELVMEVEAPQPAESPEQYGDAQWIRIYERELPRALSLAELMADNPNVVPMNDSFLESEWQLIQDEPASGGSGNRRRKRNGSEIDPTTRAIVRRIETHAFTGQYDPITHEALCADLTCDVAAPEEVGELLSTQMTAANVQADSLTISKVGGGDVDSTDRKLSCGSKCVAAYNAGTVVTLTVKADSGYTFSSWSGPCVVSGSSCTVTINGAVAVTANFTSTKSSGGSTGGSSGGGGKRK